MEKIFIYILISAYICNAGMLVRSDFTKSTNIYKDSNIVLTSGKISLDVKKNDIFKLFGDTLTAIPRSYYPAVIADPDTFTFFFADTVSKGIFKSVVRLTENGHLPVTNPTRVCSLYTEKGACIHAGKGENGILLSYIQRLNGISYPSLHVANGRVTKIIDSSKVKKFILSSQCHLQNDTFLVVNSKDNDTIMLRKIYSNGNTIQVAGSKVVCIDHDNYLTTCAVAWDKQGVIVVTWVGIDGSTHQKNVYYKAFNRDLTEIQTGTLIENVGDQNIYYYDDVAAITFKDGIVAILYWDATGIGMNTLRYNMGAMNIVSRRLISKSGIKGISAVSNGKMLYFACKGDLNNDGYSGIEGYRYGIQGESLIDQRYISYSNVSDTTKLLSDNYSMGINCAIDSNGSMGVTWKQDFKIKGSVWANRNIRHSKGFWTSPVESLSIAADDSVFYNILDVDISSLSSWYLEDSIRIGNTIAQCTTMNWNSFSNAESLPKIHTNYKYYQYRITINRKPGEDSILTPTISSVTVKWNTKPKITKLDTVKTADRTFNVLNFDTAEILSRYDTLKISVTGYDADPQDELTVFGSWPAVNQNTTTISDPYFSFKTTFLPVQNSDMVYPCSIYVKDKQNWYSDPFRFTIVSKNSLPSLSIKAIFTQQGKKDTLESNNKLNSILIQQDDSLEIIYSVNDLNDPATVKGYIQRFQNNSFTIIDSVSQWSINHLKFYGRLIETADTIKLKAEGKDPDTVISVPIKFRVNHFPVIRECRIGNSIVANLDTARIVVARSDTIEVVVSDTDCVLWDTLEYSFRTSVSEKKIKSNSQTLKFLYLPDVKDTSMTIIIRDMSGKSDSLKFFVKFPWLENDSSVNPDYVNAKNKLESGSVLVVGSQEEESINLPVKNSGNDTMVISDIKFRTNSSAWLSVIIQNQNEKIIIKSDSTGSFKPIKLLPGSTVNLRFIFSTRRMHGDSLLYDTIIFYTNDSFHSIERIPVKLEINDLPTIVKIEPEFDNNTPFNALGKSRVYKKYKFPPHSSIAISFSEPMDSISAVNGIKLYSILDARKTGVPQFLGINYSWSLDYKKVNIQPVYSSPSITFGIKPSPNLFIPTDSLKLVVTSALTDKANTPHGPNNLDVNLDSRRDIMADTSFNFKVDSVTFSLVKITPLEGDTEISVSPEIILSFNTKVQPSTVDTTLRNNTMLQIFSRYNNGKQLDFSSVIIDSNEIKIKLAGRLFYNDSLWCRYRSYSVRDYLGFPADNDFNGISSAIFDSTSTDDDMSWGYRVKSINLLSV
ncbi:MAG: hypothetical protein GX640_21005, partial [Fibrobacter sp.]|nr:hypothetical protein [Fibrobacter sp.]